jgi:hypothetical protein
VSHCSAREGWAVIGNGGGSDFAVLNAGVTGLGQSIFWAIDKLGRKCLLVETHTQHPVRTELKGVEFFVGQVANSDKVLRPCCVIACKVSQLEDKFEEFVEELRSQLLQWNFDSLLLCEAEIGRWRQFFELERGPLTREKEIGLFCELTFLAEMTSRGLPGLEAWVGPTGHRHDYAFPGCNVECKATEGREFTFQINGLSQLDEPEGNILCVFACKVEETFTGRNLRQLMDELQEKVNPVAFQQKLTQIGVTSDLRQEDCRALAIVESRAYRVGDTFPKLTKQSVPDVKGVSGISYRSDFSVAADLSISLDELAKIARGSTP